MSIEDPRLSSIDNTSAADDFDSAVEQHLGFASETVEGIEVAQAETPDAGRTDRLPTQTAAAVIPTEVTPNAENVVTLPAGIELDNLEFEVDGANLVLILADGTEIVVIGGAANIPTFVIGDVELPQVALFAALEGSNINVAAGPDGTFTAQGTPDASRNLVDNPIDAAPEDFALADLLEDTSFGDELRTGVILGADASDTEPTFLGATAGFVDEDYLENGNFNDGANGNFSFRGSLGINWGPDNANGLGNTGLTLANDRGVAFTPATLSALAAQGYTSDGVPLVYELSANGTVLTAYKDNGEGKGEEVFTVSVSDIATNGSYTFTLIGNLDHPDGQSENNIVIQFPFTAQDSDGSRASSTFSVTVNDDSPVIDGEPKPISLTVDEDDIDTSTSLGTQPNDGNGDGSFTGDPATNEGGPANATSIAGSLQSLVRIGADEKFSFSLVSIDDARAYLESLGLKSNGLPLGFDIDETGMIIGFVNSQAPGQAVPGQVYDAGPDRLVFEFEVNSDGTFKFSLHDQLDHDKLQGNDESLTIDFGSVLQANDGDGDSVSLEGLVKVNVTDDAPVINPNTKGLSVTVDEDDIDTSTSTGNAPNDGNNPDGSFTGAPGMNNGGPANATSTGSLLSLVKVGADEKVTFSLTSIEAARTYLEGLKLTSNGLPLGFDLSEDGTIIGFVNSQAPGQAVPGQVYDAGPDRLVFEFEINEDGTFTFSLSDQLDHAAGNGQNTLTIDFGAVLKATDSDGDSVALEGLVKVNVTDDIPVIAPNAKPISIKVDEDDIDTATSLGNAPNDGDNPDGSFTGTPGVNTGGPANATSTVSLASLVKVGADENVSFSLINQADMRAYLKGLKLTSNGAPLGYDLRTDGTIIAFVNAPGGAIPGQTYDSGDRLVFEFKLNGDGTVKFSLSDQLDHAAGNGENTLTIDFGSVLQANDKDGDSVKLTGLVKVDVTDDVPVIAPNATPISIKVDEDDIDTSTSLGTSPNDGNVPDGSYTGTPATNTAGPANATSTGNLSSLVKVGADENVSFSLINQADMRAYLEGLKLTSNGALIGYDLRTDGTIIAFVNAPGGAIPGQTYDSGDRLVFEFKLNSDGTFKFSLSDQLDHAAGNGQNTLTIDFGSVLQANDKDGDSVKLTGLVKVDVTDDVPELVVGAKISRTVDEDDIRNSQSMGTSPNDSNADGSYTGSPSNNQPGPAFISGSLASLVKGGADDTIKFEFIDETDLRQTLSGLKLSSNGETLSFDLQGNVLWGFANVGGPSGVSYDPENGDRPVFKLTLNQDGSYTFELIDQLDHDAGAGQNTGLLGSTADAIDFGSVIKVTDRDGDSITIGKAFSIEIRDDVPELSGAKENRLVDEDDIDTHQSLGTSPKDGEADGSWTGGPGQNGKGGAFIDGSLANLIKGGADDTVKFSFIDEDDAREALEKLGLKSQGQELSYDIRDGVLYAFDNAGSQQGESFDKGDRLVFTLTLKQDGSYSFELVDQLDHDLGKGENTDLQDGLFRGDVEAIDFGSIIKATDHDGDSVVLKDAFSITIKDDVPVLSGVKENRIVDEDDISTIGNAIPGESLGTSPNDGYADGSYTQSPSNNQAGPAFISGSLAGLVKGGADDPVKFSFISESAAVSALSSLGLSSKGAELSYDIQGKVLYGYDNDAGSSGYGNGDRLVFKLTLEDDGSYTFELADQLDHDFGKGQNFDLQDDFRYKDVEAIDFGSIIKATDYDGDSVSLGGAFSIAIRDDVPELSGKTEARIVDEDDIRNSQSLGTSPGDFAGDGSYTGGSGQGGNGPAYIEGSLAGLVKGGADDTIKFSFIDGTVARLALSALGLKSQGEALSYQIQGNTLVAYDNKAGGYGYGQGDRLVFKLTLSPNGDYTFELSDQLDHDRPTSGADENFDLQDGLWLADIEAINFGALIKATDNDGDSVSLSGAFEIKIRDDIPEASIMTKQTVTIDETAGIQNNDTIEPAVAAVFAGVANPGSVSPIFATADVIDTSFMAGADENATTKLVLRIDNAVSGLQTTAGQDITLYQENGLVVGRVGGPQGTAVFAISIDANGNVSIAQYTSLKHPDVNATDEGIDLSGKISAVFSVKDFDGDVVTKSVSIGNKIVFEDDAPGVSSGSISVAVDEDGLPTAAADSGQSGEVAGSGSALASGAAGALTALFNFGADGAHASEAISLKPTASPVDSGLNSQGADVMIKVVGDTLTGYVAGTPDRVVFELKVNADGSYDFALKDQIDHPTLDGEVGDDTENLLLSNIDLSGYIVGKDGDGDTVTLDSGKFIVSVQDDIPSVTAEIVKVSVDQPEALPPVPGKVANFVLVLDASGSTDLEEIKDQVEEFLQSVSASGAKDIRVHIVEFSDSAEPVGTYDLVVGGHIQSAVLQQAVSAVEVLQGGGNTNYEAGMQQALQWIEGVPSATLEIDRSSRFDANSLGNGQGNDDDAFILRSGSTQIALVSGWTQTGTAIGHLVDVDGSVTSGWGVEGNGYFQDSDELETNEIIRFDFGSFDNFGVAAYDDQNNFDGVPVTKATFSLDNNRWDFGSTVFAYKVVFTDGSIETGTKNVSNSDTGLVLAGTQGNIGKQIAYIEFSTSGNGVGDVDLQSVVTAAQQPGTLPNADLNKLIFLSDGEPNMTNTDDSASVNQALNAIGNEISATETAGNAGPLDQKFTIEAFGVGQGPVLSVLAKVEGPGGSASALTNNDTLSEALKSDLDSLAATPGTLTPSVGSFSVASLVKAGADESITFSLKANTSGLPALKSGNTLLTYSVENNVLTAHAGALVVFTLSLAADGKATFTLNAPIDGHGDKAIDFSSLIQAADFDGDAVSLAAGKVVVVVDGVPFGEAQSFDTQEDKSVSGTIEGIVGDEGGSFAITGNPANGTVVLNPQTGEFTYTPNENWHGTETFTVTVTDDDSDTSNPIVVTVNVASVNDAPETDAKSVSGNEDTTIPVTLSGSDIDGTIAGYVIKTLPSNGTLYSDAGLTQVIASGATVTSATVYFKPTADYNGSAAFTYAAKDNLGLEDESPATVVISVKPVNDLPVAADDLFSTKEDESIVIQLSDLTGNDSDVDGDALTVATLFAPQNGTISVVNNAIVFTPALNFNGEAGFKYSVSDGKGGYATATAKIDVIAVNDRPEVANLDVSVDEDGMLPITLSAQDVDGTIAGYIIKTVPTDGTLYSDAALTQVITAGDVLTGANVYFKPDANYHGGVALTYAAKDDLGAESASSATVVITVKSVNDLPVAVDDHFTTREDESIVISVADLVGNDYDIDGDVLTVSTIFGITNGSVAVVNGAIVFTPSPDFSGEAGFKYSVSDGNGGYAIAEAKIDVTPVNDAPVAADNNLSSVAEDSGVRIISIASLLGNDSAGPANESGQTLTITGLANVVGGTAVINGGNIEFTPTANYYGPASFDYTVRDNGTTNGVDDFKTDVGSVSFSITPVNDAPVITSAATASVAENVATSTVVYTATATDVDGPSISYSLTGTDAAKFNINPNTGAVTFKASPNYEAPSDVGGNNVYNFTVTANDGALQTTKDVALTVTNVNEAPVFTSGATASVAENVSTSTAVYTAVATDPENTSLTYSLSGVDAGRFNINSSTGAVTFKASPDYEVPSDVGGNNVYNFTVTANDGALQTTKDVALTVTNVSELAAGATVYDYGQGSNSSRDKAYNISGLNYVKSNDIDIADASSNPSIAIQARTSSNQYDYYKLVIDQNGTAVKLDIDHASNGLDTWMNVLNSSGSVIYSNDDTLVDNGSDPKSSGSSSTYDSGLSLTLDAGTYYVQVGRWASGGLFGDPKIGTFSNSSDTYELNVSVKAPGVDPIILDLDHDGFAFSSIDNGVTFDINADGKADQIAWTSDDGILAYDVDGNGLIDNGSEIFTPDFNGGKFASGVAALASLDSNGDGKIDSSDTVFGDLKIWVDANNNGVSDEGELSSLSDHGVTSISLTTDQTGGQEDGQTIFAEGEFTFADGSTGNFMEVGFDTIFGSDASDALTVIGTDGDDILHGGMGQVVMTGGAGADTFVFDETALSDLDVADVITDFNSDEGDVLDVTALLDSLLGEQPDATVETHLRATVDDGNTTVSVQTGEDTWKDVVVLQNHDTAIKVLFDDKHTTVTPHE